MNDNGNETKEQVNSSTYRMTSDVYTVGTKTDNAAARAEMQAAIAANDLAKQRKLQRIQPEQFVIEFFGEEGRQQRYRENGGR